MPRLAESGLVAVLSLAACGVEVRAELPAPGEEGLPSLAKTDPETPAGLPAPESGAAAAAPEAEAEVTAEALRIWA